VGLLLPMLKGLMTYNAPLEMSANKGNGTRLKERLVGVPVEKVWNLPILNIILLRSFEIRKTHGGPNPLAGGKADRVLILILNRSCARDCG